MLLPKTSCVCIPCIKSVAPRACLTKVPFLALFWPDTNKEMAVVIYMYLKHPQIILIPNIYGFMGQLPRFKCFVEIPFLTFFSFTQVKEEVWPSGTQPMLLPE